MRLLGSYYMIWPSGCRLEMIVKESSLYHASSDLQGTVDSNVTFVSNIPHLGEVTAEDPFGTYFVRYRQQRDLLPDGRHRHHYLLEDQHGTEHLAVVGVELHARDGHYLYHAVSLVVPLWVDLITLLHLR